ncbi:sortase [Bifidobacterium pullorum subsp. saeculare]|nr:sortase [Bifidobacterium pullorum subsp. saeculare]
MFPLHCGRFAGGRVWGKRRWGTGGGVGIYCFANVVIPIEIPPRSGRTAGGEWTKHRSLMMAYRYGNGVAGRLLTGLDELEKGDTFAFHVLDETYTYRVDRISVVLPDRLDELDIDPDTDYATLITCTPYGINTHRLLVRGHRIPNPTTPDDTGYDDPRMMTATLAGIAVAAAVALAGTAMLLASRGRRAAPAARHASDTAPRKEDDHTDRTGHPAPARPRPRHPK